MTALKSTVKKQKFFSIKILNISIFILIIISAAINLFICNDIIVKGFEIRDLSHEISLLSEKNRELESNLMTKKSYTNIKSRIDNLNLVSVDNINHLSLKETVMAKR